MTEELLREIERRTQLWREGWDCTDETTGRIKREDIPALVAEVRGLRAALSEIRELTWKSPGTQSKDEIISFYEIRVIDAIWKVSREALDGTDGH